MAVTSFIVQAPGIVNTSLFTACLLYTSDAADDLLCVDLGGRRIIKKNFCNTVVIRHFTVVTYEFL